MNHAHTPAPHHSTSHDHAHNHTHDHDHQQATAGQAEILDLDAEVLAEHTASITAWLPLRSTPHHIVDLGCGTGAGTFALLDRFPDAHITAVDASAEHMQRLRAKACARGDQERVHTVQADLDAVTWPGLGSPDLVWASASMHHMTRPERALRNVYDVLAPGGLFAVVELAGHPRFLPADAPAERPGLEERLHAAADRRQAEHMPHRGADWGPMLTAAGFTVEDERTLTVNLDLTVSVEAPLSVEAPVSVAAPVNLDGTVKNLDGAVNVDGVRRNEAVARYATGVLQRIRSAVADRIAPEDLTALDRLLDTGSPHGIAHRDDLTVRTERTVWAARRA